jgi:predicted permease
VTTTILATEYDVEPTLVSGAVFSSTLLSPIILVVLLNWLQ